MRVRCNHDLAEVQRSFRRYGWKVEHTKGNHLRWHHPDYGVVVSGSSPGSKAAIRQLKSQLRRAMLRRVRG